MSNGYYTSPVVNWPAPKNRGGYNAIQLAIQTGVKQDVQKFNASIKKQKTFLHAPQFSDHVSDFWTKRIDEYSEVQNSYVSGDINATESKRNQEDTFALWNSWQNVAPYIAALGEIVKKYGEAGELDKLNDPNLEALLYHMQRNDGSVTLQHDGNKLYLTGKGEINEKNTKGENTGNKLPWEYDLDIEAFLQSIGFNTYEEGDNETIYSNLNKIIDRKATVDTLDLKSTVDAALTQSTTLWEVPAINRNNTKTDATEKYKFIYEPLLRYNLNYGGSSSLGQNVIGSTKWVGTEDNPSIMNSPQFASYYANVLYEEYQPHYNKESEIDWLIKYDDNGNVEDKVKPWNIANEELWAPTRDLLTENAIKNESMVNQALMLTLKDGTEEDNEDGENYKEILKTDYKGDLHKFYEDYEISGDPFKYYKGVTPNAQLKWEEAAKYFYAENKETEVINEFKGNPSITLSEDQQRNVEITNKIASEGWGKNSYLNKTDIVAKINTIQGDWLENLKIGNENISIQLHDQGDDENISLWVVPGGDKKFSEEKIKFLSLNLPDWNFGKGIYNKFMDIKGKNGSQIWNMIVKELNKIGIDVTAKGI